MDTKQNLEGSENNKCGCPLCEYEKWLSKQQISSDKIKAAKQELILRKKAIDEAISLHSTSLDWFKDCYKSFQSRFNDIEFTSLSEPEKIDELLMFIAEMLKDYGELADSTIKFLNILKLKFEDKNGN
jgi:hypothetical protein